MNNKFSIRRDFIVFSLPLLLILIAGREFSGVGVFLILVTASIFLSLLASFDNIIKNSKIHHYVWASLLLIVAVFSYIGDANLEYRFSFISLAEDVYSLLILTFFFFIGRFFFSDTRRTSSHLLKIIFIGTFINLLVVFTINPDQFFAVAFQRLWNTYAIFFIVFAYFLYLKKIHFLIGIIFTCLMLVFSTSFQTTSIAIVMIFLLFVPSISIKKLSYFFIVLCSIIALMIAQVYFLIIDPSIINEYDHNFAVRAIFWKEALLTFLDEPFGFNLGVSIVSGNMEAIGETIFHGGVDPDLGVHSGLMSILYKFGIFSFFLFARGIHLLIQPSKASLSPEYKKFLIFTLFIFLTTIFANDSIFSPHFSAGVGFMLGIFSVFGKKQNHKIPKLNLISKYEAI